jgi:Flp pilus assembly pilin Flp
MAAYLLSFWHEEEGQDLVEFSLIITFVALACVSFLGIFRAPVAGMWTTSNNELAQANSVSGGS